jgi:hypothetical protein
MSGVTLLVIFLICFCMRAVPLTFKLRQVPQERLHQRERVCLPWHTGRQTLTRGVCVCVV